MVAGSNGSLEPKFSHISVGALDDDEVIVAGAVEAEQPEPAAAECAPAAPEPEVPMQPADEPSPKAEAAAPARPAKPAYQETTLADLERQPMPTAQKVVLVAAVVLIVGFAIYRLFLS